jgi:tetratricopeptide (TPR) repeat protein
MNKPTYFISYTMRTEKDRNWAAWLEWALRKVIGGNTIMQEYDFRPGDNFRALMDDALKCADIVICVLTRKYTESVNCREEWANAERFIPIKCDDFDNSEIKGLLKSRIHIDLSKSDKNDALKILQSGLQQKQRPDSEPEFPSSSAGAKLGEPTFPGFPINNLPNRNPHFTGREDMLLKIFLGLSKASTVIVAGQGGFGKTQTAIEYAYKNASSYECVWYFNAESKLRLEDDFRKFALRVVGMKTANTEDFVIVRSFIDGWLAGHTSCLFVFDNAESCPELRDYLPRGNSRAHVIVNTRERLQGVIGERLNAEVFSPADAVAFFENRVAGINEDEAMELSKTLGFLPLALEQAASYIRENQYTTRQYLELLSKYGLRVLNTPSPDTDYEKTVLTTWLITFDKIEQEEQSKAAVQLLKLCAYCAPDDIPLRMFIDGRNKLLQPLSDALNPEDAPGHDELINRLARYSLATLSGRDKNGGALLSVHRLVQTLIRHNLGDEKSWLRCCLNVASEIFNYEYGNREDFDAFAMTLPHALKIAQHAEQSLKNDDESLQSVARVYNEAGTGLRKQGMYAESLGWYRKALAIREKALGTEHPDTATTYNNIAGVYKDQGDYATALELYKKSYRTFEKSVGTDHPNAKNVYNNAKAAHAAANRADTFEKWLSE